MHLVGHHVAHPLVRMDFTIAAVGSEATPFRTRVRKCTAQYYYLFCVVASPFVFMFIVFCIAFAVVSLLRFVFFGLAIEAFPTRRDPFGRGWVGFGRGEPPRCSMCLHVCTRACSLEHLYVYAPSWPS